MNSQLVGVVHRRDLELLGSCLLERSGPETELHWPDERMQLNYTGAHGEELMRRTIDFVEFLQGHVPALYSGTWRGLDYGVGWGRIASVMSHFGPAENLDCADAWQKSLDLAGDCGLKNKLLLVSALLNENELSNEKYDFIYSYSIFTHLPPDHIVNNVRVLLSAIKPGGKLVFTVREPKFIEFLTRSGKLNPVVDRLAADGHWFGNAQSGDYGDTVVTSEWLQRHLGGLGVMSLLGVLKSEPFQSVVMITK